MVCDYSEVRRLYPSICFHFACLGAFLGSIGDCPEVGPFISRDSALGLTLAKLSPLLHQSLHWFWYIQEMLVEVRSNELDTSLLFSDKVVEADTAISSLNPSSSSRTVLRSFHALKEECSLDEDTFFRFRDRFQLPDETRIRLPHPSKKACSFNPREVCFYEAAFLSGLRFLVHPFIMELLHHLGIAPGQLMLNSWLIRLDELMYLYYLKESKEFGYYELVPWNSKARLIANLPSSFHYWKFRYFFVSGDGWETLSNDFWGDVPRLQHRLGTPKIGASFFFFFNERVPFVLSSLETNSLFFSSS